MEAPKLNTGQQAACSRGRHLGSPLHRRALSLAWAQSCPGSLVLSPSLGLNDPKDENTCRRGPSEIHRGPKGLSRWDRPRASSIHTLHSGQGQTP